MSKLLEDPINLEILKRICSGVGVEVNMNGLSKVFKKHRNTIKTHVQELFRHSIINKPIYPFLWLYQEYPLLVVVEADLPRTEEIERFLTEEEHIFGAFYIRDEEYNTLMIEFHRDLQSYGDWRKMIVAEDLIPPRDLRFPANSLMFNSSRMIKYQPYSPIHTMKSVYREGGEIELNGYRLDPLSFRILEKLMMGEGIRTNENRLAKELKIHRGTIERRISALLEQKNIIGRPACRFPRFFVPPDHVLVYLLVEVRTSWEKVIGAIKKDPHIPIAVDANVGRYNLLLFGVFSSVENHFRWLENYDARFSGCLGSMKTLYLSYDMTASIDQQKVSMGIIRKKIEEARGKRFMDMVKDAKA